MQSGLRTTLTAVALVGLSSVARAATPADVPASSPFLPAGNASAVPATSAGGLEFVAVLGDGTKTSVALYDPLTKKSRWISVPGEAGGVAVLSYNATRSEIVVRTGGTEKRLTLRKERGVVAGTAAVVGAPAPSGAPIAGTTRGATPKDKPTPPPMSPAMAKEQEESRMLVSDLLEIGAEQRKAYEAAQKKAAEPPPPAKPAAP